MYKENDMVIYGVYGVCRIDEIADKDMGGIKKKYMVLKPLNDARSTYYVPADNEQQLKKLRKILPDNEINRLIDSMPDEKAIWTDNERQRRERYRTIISEGKHPELIGMIKAIYLKGKELEKAGKKLHVSDERFLKEAEKLLYDEFKYVLHLSEDEVLRYIASRIEKK